jgi:hypothetical protein
MGSLLIGLGTTWDDANTQSAPAKVSPVRTSAKEKFHRLTVCAQYSSDPQIGLLPKGVTR